MGCTIPSSTVPKTGPMPESDVVLPRKSTSPKINIVIVKSESPQPQRNDSFITDDNAFTLSKDCPPSRRRSRNSELDPAVIGFDQNNPENSELKSSRESQTAEYIRRGDLFGKSVNAQIFQCLDMRCGEIRAIRVVSLAKELGEKTDNDHKEFHLAYFELLSNLTHKNLLQYHELMFDKGDTVEYLMEFAPGGSIIELRKRFAKIDEFLLSRYLKQVIEGLIYLHSRGISHGNLKGTNILLAADGSIKLSEYGTSQPFYKQQNTKSNAGRVSMNTWSAPEAIFNHEESPKSDVWSLGCCVIEILTGNPPWYRQALNVQEIADLLSMGQTPRIPEDLSDSCKDFLNSSLQIDHRKRATLIELETHPFVIGQIPESYESEIESKIGQIICSEVRSSSSYFVESPLRRKQFMEEDSVIQSDYVEEEKLNPQTDSDVENSQMAENEDKTHPNEDLEVETKGNTRRLYTEIYRESQVQPSIFRKKTL